MIFFATGLKAFCADVPRLPIDESICWSAFSVSVPIDKMNISTEAKQVLREHGFAFLGDVVTNKNVLKIPFFRKEENRSELETDLAARGLSLGMKIKGWQLPVFILPIDYRLNGYVIRGVTHPQIAKIRNNLQNVGVKLLGDLVQMTKEGLMAVSGIKEVFTREIEYELSQLGYGLRLGMTVDNWPPTPERREQLVKQLELERL